MKTNGLPGLLILLFLVLTSVSVHGQIWVEDFTGEADLATSGTAGGTPGGSWSVTSLPSAGIFARYNVGAPYGAIFMVNNTVAEEVWESNVINIAALGEVALEITVGGNNAGAGDYVRAYYKIDGGAEVMFAEALGSAGVSVFTAASAVVSGGTLQIVIRGMDNSAGAITNAMGFDNINVTDISILYSIASNSWNNGNTWSTGGFAGAACGCTPGSDTRVIIGNGRTVTFNVDGTASGVEIQNTGTLRWNAGGLDLAITQGGALNVQSGGFLDRNGQGTSSITFGSYTYAVTIAGTVDIGVMSFNSSGNSTIANTGTLTLASANGLFINGGDGYVITNSGTINMTDMDLNSANITLNNSGTINQTGNFTDVDAGSTFNNLAGGTWNFGGLTITAVRLFADNNSNTFNYNRAGNQSIITPQDAYSNLTLSVSGTKTAVGNFSVRGNWTKSGTATFAPGGFRVTLNGTQAQTISATGGETFANLTINNSFATSPQVTLSNNVTVSTNLTMTDGNVNLNGNTLTISSTLATALTHTMASTAGWMYGGSLTRAIPASTITVGTVAGFFPLGGSSNFRPFFIGKNNPGGSNGTLTIAHTDATTATNITFADGAATIQTRHDSFWSLSKTGVTAGTFNITAGGAGYTIGAIADTRLTRSSDATGIGTAGASTGTTSDVRVHRTGLTFGQIVNSYYVASTNSVATPLPIELAYFRAYIDGDVVISTWKTLQEKNNHFFTVQKTTDFEHFYEVGRIDGKGNNTEENTYTFTDNTPFTGRSYYRLKQTDFDGLFTYSKPVMIDYDGSFSLALKAYPNPFAGREITVELMGLDDGGYMPLYMYNQYGQKVIELTMEAEGPGVFKKLLTFPEGLSPGLYYLKAGRSLQLTGKVVVSP